MCVRSLVSAAAVCSSCCRRLLFSLPSTASTRISKFRAGSSSDREKTSVATPFKTAIMYTKKYRKYREETWSWLDSINTAVLWALFFVFFFFWLSGDWREFLQADRARGLVREVPAHAETPQDWRDLDDPSQRPHDGSPVRLAGEALPEVLRQVILLIRVAVLLSIVFFYNKDEDMSAVRSRISSKLSSEVDFCRCCARCVSF